MKHRSFLVAILFMVATFASFQSLQAQAKRALTLKEAIDLSLKNSGQLKVNQAKLQEAAASVKEAMDRRLPDASVTASHIRLTSPNIDLKTKSASTTPTTQESPKVSSATYGIANVSLPLYSGSRIKYGIESAKYLEEAIKLDGENDRDAVVLNTINAYDNLYKAAAAVDVVKENLAGARQRVKDFTNLEKNGLLARNDLLKSELQASNVELSLLDAENNYRLANINMNLMLGLPENTELSVSLADVQPVSNLKPIDDYVQLGLQHRNDIAALAYRRKAAATGTKAVQGELYPSIALTGGYIAAHVPNLLTITNAVNVGVGVQYSISSLWKNHAKVEQAKAREKQLEASTGMLSDAVRLQVNQAYQNYLLSQKKIEVYEKAVNQAQENYKIINNKYNNALATATELLDADVAQLQAKLNSAFSKSEAMVAYNKLLETTGTLYTETTK
jgi:outer membrane protein